VSTASVYTYDPPKGNVFGHIPLIKDRRKLHLAIDEFLRKCCDTFPKNDEINISVGDTSIINANTQDTFAAEISRLFGNGTTNSSLDWTLHHNERERVWSYVESVTKWPRLKFGHIDIAINYSFRFKGDRPQHDKNNDGNISFFTVYIGSRIHIVTSLVYLSRDTLLDVEKEIAAYKLFKLNRNNYRINSRKLKPGRLI
jgi:hypothetical protein